jgi:RHH-type proline utilization regulon transcriptional repressor/proline dehydrogenase/delta 1-pyrroline-5-carboxylate dehydrogenase
MQEVQPDATNEVQPFLAFAQSILPQTELRAAITAAWHRPETECLPMLLPLARRGRGAGRPCTLAARLVQGLRDAPVASGVAALVQEFSLPARKAWR